MLLLIKLSMESKTKKHLSMVCAFIYKYLLHELKRSSNVLSGFL